MLLQGGLHHIMHPQVVSVLGYQVRRRELANDVLRQQTVACTQAQVGKCSVIAPLLRARHVHRAPTFLSMALWIPRRGGFVELCTTCLGFLYGMLNESSVTSAAQVVKSSSSGGAPVFERRANHSAARGARGPERDTIASFQRCICSAVSAFFKAGLGGGLLCTCVGGLAKTSPYLNRSRIGLWSDVLKALSVSTGYSMAAAAVARPHLRVQRKSSILEDASLPCLQSRSYDGMRLAAGREPSGKATTDCRPIAAKSVINIVQWIQVS